MVRGLTWQRAGHAEPVDDAPHEEQVVRRTVRGQEAEQDYNNGVSGAASDTGDTSDGAGAGEETSEARADAIPPWCNPTDPMGAWLNHQKIQASRIFD